MRIDVPRPRVALTALVLAGTVLATVVPAATAQTATTAFINEFHYDNGGTDSGEAIEVAAPPGTDLSGWTLVLYNGGNSAPYGSAAPLPSPVPAAGVVVVEYPPNGIQNGSPDAIALVDPAGTAVQLLSYEGVLTAVGGPADGQVSVDVGVEEAGNEDPGLSLQLTGPGTTADDYTWTGPVASSFGTVNAGQSFDGGEPDPDPDPDPGPVLDPVDCTADSTPVYEIQGADAESPLAGQDVTVEAVVVGDFQGGPDDDGDLDGFYAQDPAGDGDPATSDGVFVYAPGAAQVAEGDLVRFSGIVEESFGQTQVGDLTVLGICEAGAGVPAATDVALPVDALTDLERYEGMRIEFDQPLAATETRLADDFGEIRLSAGGALANPTDRVEPGAASRALALENDLRQVLLDDARDGSRQEPIAYVAPDDTIRRGDTVTGLTGVLGYGFNAWRVQPTADVTFAAVNPRPAAPDDVGGDLRLASFNVLNYFTTLTNEDAGFARGADDEASFALQEAKIVAAITALDADVVALQEIENNRPDDPEDAIETLVAALNEEAGEGTWATVEDTSSYTGTGTTDAIRNAIIYQPAAVQPVGGVTALIDDAFDNARAPIAQTFSAGGDVFTVVSNHFKSKGCGGATGANADPGDGTGCFNADRILQAEALVDFVTGLQESSGDPDVLVLGDLNSYTQEDPIDVLDAAGLVGELEAGLDTDDRYTYVFDGEQGVLDHAFTTPALSAKVTGVDVWHINADEPDLFQYTGAFGMPDAYAASDHDPVLIGIDTEEPVPPPTVEFGRIPGRLTTGRTVPVRFELTGPDGEAIADADLFLSITRPDGGSRSLGYSADRNGSYRVQVPTERGEGGTYTLIVEDPEGTELGRLDLDVEDPRDRPRGPDRG